MSLRMKTERCGRTWMRGEWAVEEYAARVEAMDPEDCFSVSLVPDLGFGAWSLELYPKGQAGGSPDRAEMALINDLAWRMEQVWLKVAVVTGDEEEISNSSILLVDDALDFSQASRRRRVKLKRSLFPLAVRAAAMAPGGSLRLFVELAFENPLPFEARREQGEGTEDLRLVSTADGAGGWHRLLRSSEAMESGFLGAMLSTAVGKEEGKEAGPGKERTLTLGDPTELLNALVDFLQTGKTELVFQRPEDLLELAERYQVEGLKKQAEAVLMTRVKAGCLEELYQLATTYNAQLLKKEVTRFLATGEPGKKEVKELHKAFPSLTLDAVLQLPAETEPTSVGRCCRKRDFGEGHRYGRRRSLS